ncbi:hypothetical protein SOVF_167620 [Spinacia oleracea]|nr:hypothetical protein SOVF_167620 [Spinacia oleracea]
MSLAKHNALQWCLKQVVIEDAPHEEVGDHVVAKDVDQGATAHEDGDHAVAEDVDHTHTAPVKD